VDAQDAVLTDLAREVVPDDRWGEMLRRVFGADSAAPVRTLRDDVGVPGGATPVRDDCVVRFDRTLAVAAASGGRRLQGRQTNADGDLLTDVQETSDGRLVVTISARPGADAGMGTAPLVVLRWETRMHQPAVVECSRALATPLAPGVDGRLIARYELGSVEHLDALAVHPAVWADPDEVEDEAVRTAFSVTAYGNALRAWRRYLDHAPARLAGLIRQLLPPTASDPS
jgi:hypothetical protein